MSDALKTPFPWFGGKSRVAALVWSRFGPVANYVEPFFGSGAVLLGRPDFDAADPTVETVNDKDGFVANFWRAVQHDPEAVAHWADWPVNENDLHARHIWLVGIRDEFVARLEGDPDYYDAKIAGWWCWGICCWIGGGWCSGSGPWSVEEGQLVHLGNKGQGVNGRLVHLGNAGKDEMGLRQWMETLCARLARVRVCCGDWSRVCGPSVTYKHGLTAVLLDPPYSAEAGRDESIYREEDLTVAHAVREWCLTNGDNPLLRIALCGYEGEHQMPDAWKCVPWKASGGYGSKGNGKGRTNMVRERVWFSPACLRGQQADLFAAPEAHA